MDPPVEEYNPSLSAAIAAADLITIARLILKLDSELTKYSADYLVENACPKKKDGQGEADDLTVKCALEYILKHGIPKADNSEKNYQMPFRLRPSNLLSRRKAFARSIELQRREALKHHVADLQEQIELLKTGQECDKETSKKSDGEEEENLYLRVDESDFSSDEDDPEKNETFLSEEEEEET